VGPSGHHGGPAPRQRAEHGRLGGEGLCRSADYHARRQPGLSHRETGQGHGVRLLREAPEVQDDGGPAGLAGGPGRGREATPTELLAQMDDGRAVLERPDEGLTRGARHRRRVRDQLGQRRILLVPAEQPLQHAVRNAQAAG